MIFTARPALSSASCTSRQRVPERTVIVFAAVSSATTPRNCRMSSWVPSGVAVWPPML
jgi:hypothetical protein